MKKSLFVLLIGLSALSARADLPKGGIFYSSGLMYCVLDAETQEVSVSGFDPSAGNVSSVIIPDWVVDVEDGNCKHPVVSVGQNAFKDRTNIVSVSMDANENLKKIGDSAFAGCTKLNAVTIRYSAPDLKMGAYVFDGCSALEKVSITGDISGADYLFHNCTALKSIAIGADMGTVIPAHCFDGCTALSSVSGMGDITSVGDYAFNETKSLTSIDWPASLTYLGEYAFYQSYITNDVVLNGNAVLGKYALSTSHIASVSFGQGITEIPDNFCFGCDYLKTVNTGAVERVNAEAFKYCPALEEVTMDVNMKEVGSEAFRSYKDYNALKVVTVMAAVPPTMLDRTSANADFTFSSWAYQNATLRVSSSSLNLYKNAFVWQNFKSIEAIPVSSVVDVEVESSAPAVYYGLDGVVVKNPERGVFIRVRGDKAEKVVL